MAYEQTTTRSLGQRLAGLGEGIANAGKGVMESMDWAQRRKHTEMQMGVLQQQMDLQDQKIKEARAQGYDLAHTKLWDIFAEASQSDDPGAVIRLNAPRMAQWSQLAGEPFDPQNTKPAEQAARDLGSAVGGDFKIVSGAMASILNAATSDQAAEAQYKAGREALTRMRSKAPGLMQTLAVKADALDQAYEKHYGARMGVEAARLKLTLAGQKPTVFDTALDKKQAAELSDSLKAAPDLQSRRDNLSRIQSLVEGGKVFTGEVSGSDLTQRLQRINTPEAQELSNLLSIEGINAIMTMAKSAGVRAIDTEPERQFLLRTVASAKFSPAVLKKIISNAQSVIDKTLNRTEAKQRYYEEHGNLRNFGLGTGAGSGGKLDLSAAFDAVK